MLAQWVAVEVFVTVIKSCLSDQALDLATRVKGQIGSHMLLV